VTGERIVGVEARDPLYFLWSLERMAVIYDLTTIGDREWYPWCAEMLVAVQRADGSWQAPYPGPVGTCFALLILKRSNFAKDLQLTVRNPSTPGFTSRPSDAAALPGTARRPRPTPALGPGVTQTPNPPGGNPKPQSPVGVMEIPKPR
jgi:hypothetical protein